jgi:hypothetical protein
VEYTEQTSPKCVGGLEIKSCPNENTGRKNLPSRFFWVCMNKILWENNPLVSLYLNIFIANLFLIIIYLYYKDEPIVLASIFTGLYFIVLLKIQTVTGLEHILHIFFITIFWLSLFKWIESNYLKNNHLYLVYLSSF